MRRILLVLGIVVLMVLSIVGIAVASDSYVLSNLSGAFQRDGLTIVEHDYNWTSAPENPNIVYVAVWTPNPYREYIENALVRVVEKHGLKPVIVDDVQNYDLKGRLVLFYGPVVGWDNRLLYREVSISGILYYSYAGDAKSAVDAINSGLVFSETEISRSSEKFCGADMNRLMELRIANQTCAVAYWLGLKAKVGKLKRADPYGMIAGEIASQLDQFLTSDSNEA